MKKIFTLVCAAVLALSAVNAKLIFQESFDGKNGTVGQLAAGATNTEDFFDGSSYNETRWWSYSGSSNYIQVAEGSLSYPGYQNPGVGNKAYLWSSGADDVRSFSSQAVTSGKVYLSAIINVEELSTDTTGDYFLSLGDHANNIYVGRLYSKSVKENDQWVGYKLGIAKNNESAKYLHYSEEVFAPNTDVLVVIEYEFVAGEKNDVARLYINPTKATIVPTVVICPDTVTGGGVEQGANAKPDAGAHGIFGVFMRQGYNSTAKVRSTPKLYIDEIKVATAWADLFVEGSGEEEEKKDEADNIAALKAYTPYKTVLLKSEPVVVNIANGDVAIQDSTGAILVNDYGDYKLLKDVKVGDKISNLSVQMTEEDKFINGLPTARLSYKTTPSVISSGNAPEPFEVSLAEVGKYGPACVQLTEVVFESGALKKFDVGLLAISQNEVQADLNIPNGCNIIGEDIPAKADIKAIVIKNDTEVRIQISQSADITNRVAPGEETGIETHSMHGHSTKVIRNGQLIILRDGKKFNVIGVEIQ